MSTDLPTAPAPLAFRDLSLNEALVRALADVGYESPSPIQAATIPRMLDGADVVGQAQTGTGKTAAFALPILSRIDLQQRAPQALVLVPTRELAIQVAEAFQRYAAHLTGFHVVPIYGGQSYTPQLHSLRRGVHVVVGTPGRVMDHIKRETLQLATLKYFVLVLLLIVTSAGLRRWFCAIRRTAAGMVAENSAICRSFGACSRIHSTSSMNPMRSISSASSSTKCLSVASCRVSRLM